jgi:short-subunit dehydrogenase
MNTVDSIIITGISRGIGYALVNWFLQNTSLNIIGLTRSKLATWVSLESEYKDRLTILPFDITSDEAEYELLVKKWKSDKVNVRYLINNSGVLINKPFSELTALDFQEQWNVNVLSCFKLMKHLSSLMNSGSHIVNIGSMGGYQGSSKFPGLSQYSATKGALAILTECFAEEKKHEGISANCLALGAVDTEMLCEAFPGYHSGMSAENMAQFIAQFTLSGNQFFNGKVLPVSSSTP